MLYEPSIIPHNVGWIEVICGGMFSGKTEELIRRAKRAHIAGQSVIVVKPALDNRYSDKEIVSHDESVLPGLVVDTADQIVLLTGESDVICIDEAQFFDDRIIEVSNSLANDGKRVIIAGLDMDYEGRPFEPMPQLLAIAEYVTKLHAICSESGAMAHYSSALSIMKIVYWWAMLMPMSRGHATVSVPLWTNGAASRSARSNTTKKKMTSPNPRNPRKTPI